ncbi:MAG: type 1 glutamine amidotransferase [bacterium]|nr:type 1 glutamine amidotransferase [bacterium]
MRLHLLEHDCEDFSRTNISFWAAEKGYRVNQSFVCNNEKLPPVDSFDWLMIMGGSQHAWDEQGNTWLQEEKALLGEALTKGKIILGICFGAQLLADALGGKIFPNDQKEIGWYEVNLTSEGRNSFLFRNIPKRFTTFHWHGDHFSLPPPCTRLAFSEPTANQAYTCQKRPVVGVQFHPEYTREMVRHFARVEGNEWQKNHFVADKEAVLVQTDEIPDTYWLMAALLDNMDREFAGNG